MEIYNLEIKIFTGLVIALIILAILNKVFPGFFIKLCIHTILYCLEIILVTCFINSIFINFELFNPPSNYLEALRNYVFYYTLYQLLLMVTFKLYDAAETDALTAIKSAIDKFQVFAEFDRKISKVDLAQLQETIYSSKITFAKRHRDQLIELLEYLENYNNELISKEDIRGYLKIQSLNIDLKIKTISYSWMNSILLRVIK